MPENFESIRNSFGGLLSMLREDLEDYAHFLLRRLPLTSDDERGCAAIVVATASQKFAISGVANELNALSTSFLDLGFSVPSAQAMDRQIEAGFLDLLWCAWREDDSEDLKRIAQNRLEAFFARISDVEFAGGVGFHISAACAGMLACSERFSGSPLAVQIGSAKRIRHAEQTGQV